jgi:hypothetical protein
MKTYTIPLTLIALAVMALAAVLLLKPMYQAYGSAFTGSAAYLQNATTTAVGPQDGDDTIFAVNADCKARVVSTLGGSAIMLNFGDPGTDRLSNVSSTTLSGVIGHWQAASTTVAYDSGLYGCGRWTAFSYASQTITVSEF